MSIVRDVPHATPLCTSNKSSPTWMLFAVLVVTPILISSHTLIKAWWFSGTVDLFLWLPHALALIMVGWQKPCVLQPHLADWGFIHWLLLVALGCFVMLFPHAWLRDTIVWQTAVAESVRWISIAVFAVAVVQLLTPRQLLWGLLLGLTLFIWLNLSLSWWGVVNYSIYDIASPVLSRNSSIAREIGLSLPIRLLPLGTGLFPLAVPLGVCSMMFLVYLLGQRPSRPFSGMLLVTLGLLGSLLSLLYLDREAPAKFIPLLLVPTLIAWRWGPLWLLVIPVILAPIAGPLFLVIFPEFAPNWTLSGRRILWTQWMGYIVEQPQCVIIGKGFHGELPIFADGFSTRRNLEPHNMILQALLEGGIIWLGLLMSSFTVLLYRWWQRLRYCTGMYRTEALIAATAVLSVWWNGSTVEVLGPNYQIPTFLLILFAALLLQRQTCTPLSLTLTQDNPNYN